MRSTRFNEVLGLIIKDSARFTDMVNSPFFNKNRRVTALWKWITENPKKDYLREDLFKAAKGKGSLSGANFRMVMSDFVKLAEKFLLLKNGDIIYNQNDVLLEIFRGNHLKKSYNNHLRRLKIAISVTANKDVDYYNKLYLLECEHLSLDKNRRKKEDRLEKINLLTDLIWTCMKLDGIIKILFTSNNINQILFYKELMNSIEKDILNYRRFHPVIYSRYLIIKMFELNLTEKNIFLKKLKLYTQKNGINELQKYNDEAISIFYKLRNYNNNE